MKEPPFFVTGFPRSRTAWIANFLTYRRGYCHHDALRLGTTPEFLKEVFANTEREYFNGIDTVGDSDSGLLAIAPKVVDAFPKSRWVLIEREPEEAVASYHNAFKERPYPQSPRLNLQETRQMIGICKRWSDRVKAVVPRHLLMVLQFEDLEEERGAVALWDWCLRSTPFNYERYKMLNSFRVTIIPEKTEVMADAAARWAEVM